MTLTLAEPIHASRDWLRTEHLPGDPTHNFENWFSMDWVEGAKFPSSPLTLIHSATLGIQSRAEVLISVRLRLKNRRKWVGSMQRRPPEVSIWLLHSLHTTTRLLRHAEREKRLRCVYTTEEYCDAKERSRRRNKARRKAGFAPSLWNYKKTKRAVDLVHVCFWTMGCAQGIF